MFADAPVVLRKELSQLRLSAATTKALMNATLCGYEERRGGRRSINRTLTFLCNFSPICWLVLVVHDFLLCAWKVF